MTLEFKRAEYGGPDYRAILKLRREVLRKPLGLEFLPEQLARETADRHFALWEGGRPAACLLLRDAGRGEAQMRQVAVSEDRRGRGLGRRLVEASEQEARRLGFERMVLNAREEAVGFYLRLGYAIEGEPFIEIGIPHRRMAKDL